MELPNRVRRELERTSAKGQYTAAVNQLAAATAAYVRGDYQAAAQHGRKAKRAAPRDPAVREIIGLAAYRLGDWKAALSELRTYRRLTAEPTHIPVELDVLRAMGRGDDIRKAWNDLTHAGASRDIMNEGKVVYASYLADGGKLDAAWEVIAPRSTTVMKPGDERVWYVAARIAALRGDRELARSMGETLFKSDPNFPGLDDLKELILK